MDAFTPQQTIELMSRPGCKKAYMRLDKLCAVLVSTNASPWHQQNAPGLLRTLGAFMFPLGLVTIVLSGADPFTNNVMSNGKLTPAIMQFIAIAFLHKRVSLVDVTVSRTVSYLGILAGMLFFMVVITGYGGVFEVAPAYPDAAIALVVQKAQNLYWHQIFQRAVGANCMLRGLHLDFQSRNKLKDNCHMVAPAIFVASALGHVVANMFFVPLAIWCGAPLGAEYYIWKSMLPTALGNIVRGGVFVGTAYWYLNLTGEVDVNVQFDTGSLSTAEVVSGPMRSGRRSGRQADGLVLDGVDAGSQRHVIESNQLPDSGSSLKSSLGAELCDDTPFTKTHAEWVPSKGNNGDKRV